MYKQFKSLQLEAFNPCFTLRYECVFLLVSFPRLVNQWSKILLVKQRIIPQFSICQFHQRVQKDQRVSKNSTTVNCCNYTIVRNC